MRNVTSNVKDLTARLAGIALSEAQKPALVEAGDDLLEVTKRLQERIAELEAKEPFEGEAPYWTVFRLFCIEDNRGKVFTLDEILQYLALSYDMSAETYDTLDETLAEWAEDIAEDAKEIFRVHGTFKQIGDDGYAFVESLRQPKLKPTRSKKVEETSQKPTLQDILQPIAAHERDKEQEVLEAVMLILADGPARQPDVRKALVAVMPGVEYDSSLQILDSLVEKRLLFRFKVASAKKGAAYLSLNEEDALRASETQDEQQAGKELGKKEVRLDIPVAVATINALLSKEKWNQRFTVQNIWASLDDAVKDSLQGSESTRKREEAGVKAVGTACQVLSRFGIIERGMFRIRSRGRREFKSGIASHEIWEYLKQLSPRELEQFLQAELQRVNLPNSDS